MQQLRTRPWFSPTASAKAVDGYTPSAQGLVRALVQPDRVGEVGGPVHPVGPGADPGPGALLGHLEHPAEQRLDEVGALALAELQQPGPDPVGSRAASLEVDRDHLRRANAERLEHGHYVVAELEVLADLGRRQVESLLEPGGGPDGLA